MTRETFQKKLRQEKLNRSQFRQFVCSTCK